jgi:hypothetical protein
MHINIAMVLGSVVVGFLVGLTGMGGGALMTPMLVLLFGVSPAAAISSDLVAALFMKPLGVAMHWRKKTVNWSLVRQLSVGSIPAAIAGTYVLHLLGASKSTQSHLKFVLAIALLIGGVAMVARLILPVKSSNAPLVARPVLVALIGLFGGFMVGLTSVGAGSLILVLLTLLYPAIRSDQLVGTDLAQSIPLTAAATLGAILFGHIQLSVTTSIVIGAVPAVVLGSYLSSRGFNQTLRPFLAGVAILSGLKYANMPTRSLGVAAVALALAATALALRVARRQREQLSLESTNH